MGLFEDLVRWQMTEATVAGSQQTGQAVKRHCYFNMIFELFGTRDQMGECIGKIMPYFKENGVCFPFFAYRENPDVPHVTLGLLSEDLLKDEKPTSRLVSGLMQNLNEKTTKENPFLVGVFVRRYYVKGLMTRPEDHALYFIPVIIYNAAKAEFAKHPGPSQTFESFNGKVIDGKQFWMICSCIYKEELHLRKGNVVLLGSVFAKYYKRYILP